MLGRSRGKRGSRRRGNLTPWTGLLLLVLGWAACYFSYVSPVWGEGSRIQDSDGASQPSTIEEENEPSPATLSSVEPSQEEEDYPPPHDEGTMKAVSASAWRSPVAPNFHAARRARHFSGRDRTYTDLKHMKNGIERKEKLKHWTDLSLEELSGFYKGLKYKDVVIERWFDKDYERLVNRNRETWTNKAEGERIPRKLHFTWKTSNLGELPDLFRRIQVKWRILNPTWEIKIWTDEECEAFVRDHYPEYYDLYTDFEVTALRSDPFRYLVLDKIGGYYADMDMEPLQPMNGLVRVMKNPECVVVRIRKL